MTKEIKVVPENYYESEEYKKFCIERTNKYNNLIKKGEIQGEIKDQSELISLDEDAKKKEMEQLLAEAEVRKSNREAKERKKKLDNKIKKEQNEARKKEVIDKDAANKPLFNLYKKNEWKIHLERLDKFKKSMWGGEVFYVGKRGGIYTIKGNGIRDYRW